MTTPFTHFKKDNATLLCSLLIALFAAGLLVGTSVMAEAQSAEPISNAQTREPRVVRTDTTDPCTVRRETGGSVRRYVDSTVYSTQAPPLAGCKDNPANPRDRANRAEHPIVVIELEPEIHGGYTTDD